MRGKRYQNEKKVISNPNGKNQHSSEVSDQNDHQPKKEKTAEKIAKELSVSSPTIRRDAEFAESVDVIEETVGKEAKSKILGGKTKLTKQETKKVAKVAQYNPRQAKQIIETGNKEELRKAHNEVVKKEAIEKEQEKELEQEKVAVQQAIEPKQESKPVEVKQPEQVPLLELKAPEPVKQGNETFTDEKGRVLHIVHSDNKQSKFNETNESIES